MQHPALPTRLNALPCHACFLSAQQSQGNSKEQHKYLLGGTKPIHFVSSKRGTTARTLKAAWTGRLYSSCQHRRREKSWGEGHRLSAEGPHMPALHRL